MTQVRMGVDLPDGTASSGSRTIRRRTGLPSGRAVVGGFLVAVATVGVFAAYTAATSLPTTSYVVAARDLAPGERIDAGAVRLVPLDLPDEQRRRAYDAVAPLVEATVVEPLIEGELLQEGSLIATGADSGTRTVSFAIEPARAVNGLLRAGERIDLLATFGAGTEACTHPVAADVAVVDVAESAGSIVGQSGGLTITVAVADADAAAAIAHATNAGAVTLVRTTHARADTTDRYCTPAAMAPEPAG